MCGYVQITLDGKRPINHVKEHLAKALCDVIDDYSKEEDISNITRVMHLSLTRRYFSLKNFESENVVIKIFNNTHSIAFYPKGFPKGSKYYLVIDNKVYELRNEADILEIKKMLSIFYQMIEDLEDLDKKCHFGYPARWEFNSEEEWEKHAKKHVEKWTQKALDLMKETKKELIAYANA